MIFLDNNNEVKLVKALFSVDDIVGVESFLHDFDGDDVDEFVLRWKDEHESKYIVYRYQNGLRKLYETYEKN